MRPALPNEIPSQEMSKEELLAEAKRRYPVGTRHYGRNGKTTNSVYEVTKIEWCGNYMYGGSDGIIYGDGKWAEIVEPVSAAQMIEKSHPWTPQKIEKPRLILLGDDELLSVKCDNEVKINLDYEV